MWLCRRFPALCGWSLGRPASWSEIDRSHVARAAQIFPGETFDRVHVFRLIAARSALARARRQYPPPELFLDLDDLEAKTHGRIAALARQRGDHRVATFNATNASQLARQERALLPRFHRLFVCSANDAARLAPLPAHVLPNTCERAPDLPPPPGPPFRALFLGTLDYYPNEEGLRWLLESLLPLLDPSSIALHVFGRNLPPRLLPLVAPRAGIVFHGEVPTASAAFTQTHALLAPIRAGGGTRLKIVEAFAHGRPVISTALGIEGIEATPGRDFLPAESPAEFAHQLRRLAENPDLARTVGACGREVWTRHHDPRRLPDLLRP